MPRDILVCFICMERSRQTGDPLLVFIYEFLRICIFSNRYSCNLSDMKKIQNLAQLFAYIKIYRFIQFMCKENLIHVEWHTPFKDDKTYLYLPPDCWRTPDSSPSVLPEKGHASIRHVQSCCWLWLNLVMLQTAIGYNYMYRSVPLCTSQFAVDF